jgi:hypothetical protein
LSRNTSADEAREIARELNGAVKDARAVLRELHEQIPMIGVLVDVRLEAEAERIRVGMQKTEDRLLKAVSRMVTRLVALTAEIVQTATPGGPIGVGPQHFAHLLAGEMLMLSDEKERQAILDVLQKIRDRGV